MIQEMALQAITADKVVEVVKDQVMMTAREALKRLPSLQEATMSWLDQYQKGRFEVYVDTSGLDKSVDKLSSFGRQVVIAMILVGMLIGSAIATSVLAFIEPEGQLWQFTFRLAYLGFVAAMVVAHPYRPSLAVALDQRRVCGRGLGSTGFQGQDRGV